jgi:hypothetical protein
MVCVQIFRARPTQQNKGKSCVNCVYNSLLFVFVGRQYILGLLRKMFYFNRRVDRSRKANGVAFMLTWFESCWWLLVWTLRKLVRFQVLTAASMKFRFVFLDVLPCKIIVDRRFRGTCCLHQHRPDDGGSTYLWNVGRQIFYTVVHPRKQIWTSKTYLWSYCQWRRNSLATPCERLWRYPKSNVFNSMFWITWRTFQHLL